MHQKFSRWENTGKDMLRCAHCDSAICVTLHPGLDEKSRDGICQKYLDMLVSSHSSTCAYRSHASRMSRVMGKCNNPGGGGGGGGEEEGGSKNRSAEMIVIAEEEGCDPEHLLLLASEVGDAPGEGDRSNGSNFYVPPYFLAISDEFLRFEDRTSDGSITRDLVDAGAARIRDELQSMDIIGESQVDDVTVPDAVKEFCDFLHQPGGGGVDLQHGVLYDEVDRSGGMTRTSYLLSAFGWSVCGEETVAGGTAGVVLKCTMCQARSLLRPSRSSTGEKTPAKKKRRIDDASSITLVDSHRVYCPYVSGFSFRPGRRSHLPGWKVVVTNLLKKASPISDSLKATNK